MQHNCGGMTPGQMIRCLDLTSLTGQETEADIIKLCNLGVSPLGQVAALCIYPQFLQLAKTHCPSNES